jgi:hypothetical protein
MFLFSVSIAKTPMVDNYKDEERPIPPPFGFNQEGLVKDDKHVDSEYGNCLFVVIL